MNQLIDEFYMISTISVSGKEITLDNQPFRQVRNIVSVAMQPKLSSALGHNFRIGPKDIEAGTSTWQTNMRP